MKMLRAMFSLDCQEVGWEPGLYIRETRSDEHILHLGGVRIAVESPGKRYLVELFRVDNDGLFDEENLEHGRCAYTAKGAVMAAVKHILYAELLQHLPNTIADEVDDELLTFAG